ncbi:hypothetical protein CI109_105639 [Kwoniella shandongensis]|uniref:2-dehydropantoate 2-reductase n=1 Tax=Kwoniella shandongensis TaxID=1734106 RepID=A0A5M6C410_9TREE|nr:uncharacterized protein CI109_002355 [Kwoniella shandongensis]KAA5529460.1 hypothetical protein CI109_002355 [Kwoniella shandongensis]
MLTRIHVLGVGSIGTLLSHHLRLNNPSLPLTLLVRKPHLYPPTLSVTRDGLTATSTNYTYEPSSLTSTSTPISSLIVCLKTTSTLDALRPLTPLLGPGSVVTLLQNGMGVYEELCTNLWPDKKTRPYFILGTTPHGVTPIEGRGKGEIRHNTPGGEGDVKWGICPDPRNTIDFEKDWLFPPSSTRSTSTSLTVPPVPKERPDLISIRDTLHALLSISDLSPSLQTYKSLQRALYLKLVVNAVINPLTAILGHGNLLNGTLASISPFGPNLVDQITEESSRVLIAHIMATHTNDEERDHLLEQFNYDRLRELVGGVIHSAGKNTSSMAVDVREGRTTEVDYINGYIVKLGREVGIETPCNSMLVDMVKFITASKQI